MRAGLAIIAATLLAGCASSAMNQARVGQPDRIFNSTKEQSKVVECVQFTWQDEAAFGVDASGYLEQAAGVVTVSTRGAEYFADIAAAGSGSLVKFYAQKDDALAQRRMAALATCL